VKGLLKLEVDWCQFDALWTKIDYRRSGDIDLDEFKRFFGDLSEFETLEGTQSLNISANQSHGMDQLTRCLFQVCDQLRSGGFTVADMFAGFDRNASGSISISEFCSMLRMILGHTAFDKKLIYQALFVLDSDGDKNVSLREMQKFVYQIWRNQLDELAVKLASVSERGPSPNETKTEYARYVERVLEERRSIKEAVKKNFPRQWRDHMEQEAGGHAIPGPFAALLQRMDMAPPSEGAQATLDRSGSKARVTLSPTRDLPVGARDKKIESGYLTLSAPSSPKHHPSRPPYTHGNNKFNNQTNPAHLMRSGPHHQQTQQQINHQATVAGRNTVMRFKIKIPFQGARQSRPSDVYAERINIAESMTVQAEGAKDLLRKKQ
jgi:hypothetical protein